MKKLLRFIMAMVLTALLLTACGGGEEKKSTAQSVEPPKTEEKSEPEKAPEEAKTAMTAAEKELYDSAYPIMGELLEGMDKIVEFIEQSKSNPEANPNWQEEAKVMLQGVMEESNKLGKLNYTEETETLKNIIDTFDFYLCIGDVNLQEIIKGAAEEEEALKFANATVKEIEFYERNGFELYVQFAEDVKSVVKNSEVYSAKGGGGKFSVELDFEVSSLNKVTKKTA